MDLAASPSSALAVLFLLATSCAPPDGASASDAPASDPSSSEARERPGKSGTAPGKLKEGRKDGPVTEPDPDPGLDTGADTAAPGDVLFSDDFEDHPLGEGYLDGEAMGAWVVHFTGYGSVGIEDDEDGSRVHTQVPAVAGRADRTHASLVYTEAVFEGDLDVTVRMKTVEQVRTGTAPNPWEVGWLLWHFDTEVTERAYYVILKPNGWEIGKFFGHPPDNQEFLATGSHPDLTLGAWHTVRVRQVDATITLWIDGTTVATVTDDRSRWDVFRHGSVALYNEDAHVHFDDVVVRAP